MVSLAVDSLGFGRGPAWVEKRRGRLEIWRLVGRGLPAVRFGGVDTSFTLVAEPPALKQSWGHPGDYLF